MLKADGEQETFRYGSSLWTTEELLNELELDIDATEHKGAAFHRVVGSRLRVVMRECERACPQGCDEGTVCCVDEAQCVDGGAEPMGVEFETPRSSLGHLIADEVYTEIPGDEGSVDEWRALMVNPDTLTFHWPDGAERCLRYGLNAWGKLRIGAHGRRYTPNDNTCHVGLGNWIGVGSAWDHETMPSVGNGYKHHSDGRVVTTRPAFAYVYVR